MTGETRTHNDRGHNPALLPVELRPQRRRLESNQHWGLAPFRALQTRALPLGHVVGRATAVYPRIARAHAMEPPAPPLHLVMHAAQGSNLSLPALEAGVPPLELAAHLNA